MGDLRFDAAYEAIVASRDRARTIRDMSDAEVIHALAAASRRMDAYVANVLAVEVLNRRRRQRAILWGAVAGLATTIALRTILLFTTGQEAWVVVLSLVALVPAALVGLGVYLIMIRRRDD